MNDLPHHALSVRQPWAYAIVMGWKPVENRSWKGKNPDLDFRGRFAVHASQGMTRAEYEDAAETFADCGFICPPPAELLRGGIIGVASVVDVVTRMDSRWFFGPKGLVIADAKPIDFIGVGGQLGFFEWKRLLPFAGSGRGKLPVPPAKWMLPGIDPPPKAPRSQRRATSDAQQERLL